MARSSRTGACAASTIRLPSCTARSPHTIAAPTRPAPSGCSRESAIDPAARARAHARTRARRGPNRHARGTTVIGVETLRIAWGGIVANKLRSGLTILGMTIGVASVIILIAVGNGSSQTIEERIESLGTNVLLVEAGGIRGGARFGGAAGGSVALTKQDAAALQSKSEAPDVQSAAPVVNASAVTLVYKGTSYEPGTFVGTTPSYLAAHGYHVAEGTGLTDYQVAHHERVAVIGQTVAEELFPGQDPVGQTMRANGVNFEVVGVLAPKGSNGVSTLGEIVARPISAV